MASCLLAAVALALDPGSEPVHTRLVLSPKQVAATGEFRPGNEWQEIKFTKPIKGRYFCLDALSSQDGKPFASVAELEMLDATGELLSREDWKIVLADSEEHEREDGSATNAIDGVESTHWHTQWSETPPAFPHRLIVDLGRSVTLTGFRYLPRQGDANTGGRIKEYQISLS